MGTDAALLMAVTTVSLLLPLVVIKHMMRRILRHRYGDAVAQNRFEAGRLVIVSCTAAFMLGAVLMLGPGTIAPDMIAPAPGPVPVTVIAEAR
ncbi:hypothetical protein [Ponticoccus litoralis]|uniref:Uncharacterized protein n=1 Tax=Ponticoccus litoralis TaxID=422297 RepID=A0AAW9SKQ5_9RHOB